jgi:hypothetical protein
MKQQLESIEDIETRLLRLGLPTIEKKQIALVLHIGHRPV